MASCAQHALLRWHHHRHEGAADRDPEPVVVNGPDDLPLDRLVVLGLEDRVEVRVLAKYYEAVEGQVVRSVHHRGFRIAVRRALVPVMVPA